MLGTKFSGLAERAGFAWCRSMRIYTNDFRMRVTCIAEKELVIEEQYKRVK